MDLGRPEQAVAVGVLVGVGRHEVAARRVSGLDALREAPQPEDDRIAQRVGLQDPAANAEGRRVEVDLERLTVDDVGRGRDLHALVAHGPEVLELRAGIDHARGQTAAATGRQRHGDQRVVRHLVVIGERQGGATAREFRVQPQLGLVGPLGLQFDITEATRRHPRDVGARQRDRCEDVVVQRVERTGVEPRGADRTPQPQRIEPAEAREEGLLRHDPRGGELRVQDVPERPAERRVVVAAQGPGHEEPVLPPEPLLGEAADRHELLRRFTVRGWQHAHVQGAGGRPLRAGLAGPQDAVKQVVEVLEARRGAGRQRRRQIERRRGPDVRRPEVDLERVRGATAERCVRIEGQRDRPGHEALLVVSVREVDPDRGLRLQEGERAIVPVQAPREAVDLLKRTDREALRRRQESVAVAPVGTVGRSQIAAREHPEHVVVVLRQAQVPGRVQGFRLEVQVRARLLVEARQQVHRTLLVDRVHPLLSRVVPRHVVGGLLGPAGRRQVEGGVVPRLEGTEHHDRVERAQPRDVAMPGRRGRQGGSRERARRVEGGQGGIVRRVRPDVVDEPALRAEVPPRGPRLPPLGLQLDHAVGRVGAVQHAGRRAAHDLHRLEILGVEVVETGGRLASHPHRRRGGAVLDANPIDDQDRLVGECDAVRSADPDAGPAAGGTAARQHLDSRGARVEQVGQRVGRRLLHHFGGVEFLHRVPLLATALLAGGRHDDLLERHHRRREVDLHRRGLAGAYRHGFDGGAVPDQADPDLQLARGEVGEMELPFDVAEGAGRGPGNEDLRADERALGGRVQHAPADRSCGQLRCPDADARAQQQRGHGPQADGSHGRSVDGREIAHRCPQSERSLRRGRAAGEVALVVYGLLTRVSPDGRTSEHTRRRRNGGCLVSDNADWTTSQEGLGPGA